MANKILTSILIGLGVGLLYITIHTGLHFIGAATLFPDNPMLNFLIFVNTGIFILGFLVGIIFYIMREK